jgi:hypothetical protein
MLALYGIRRSLEYLPGKTNRMTKLQSMVIPPAQRNMYFHVDAPNGPWIWPRPHEISGVIISATPFIPHQRLILSDCSLRFHQKVTYTKNDGAMKDSIQPRKKRLTIRPP